MPEIVEHATAKNKLMEAWENCETIQIDERILRQLTAILGHDHKTFRYILLNGILAKCTNLNINPIALQAGAEITGSFDARSLCHKVLVPFEQEKMDDRLGGSNEPFLNKPARFKTLSRENAVRRGKDKETLFKIIELFESNSLNADPDIYLLHTLHIIKQFAPNKIVWRPKDYTEILSQHNLQKSIDELLTQPFEGASLVYATLMILEAMRLSNNWEILISSNPLNQSGSSSNEICDIDLKSSSNEFTTGFEIKDKDYIETDIHHAVTKVKEQGGNRMVFLSRELSQYKGSTKIDDLVGAQLEEGFDLCVLEFNHFRFSSSLMTSSVKKEEYINVVNDHIGRMKPTKTFVGHISKAFNVL